MYEEVHFLILPSLSWSDSCPNTCHSSWWGAHLKWYLLQNRGWCLQRSHQVMKQMVICNKNANTKIQAAQLLTHKLCNGVAQNSLKKHKKRKKRKKKRNCKTLRFFVQVLPATHSSCFLSLLSLLWPDTWNNSPDQKIYISPKNILNITQGHR